ncbi:UNVERIFIED_CONTAM: FOG: Ankyrin repeat [Acetivibrio alkalicellulosi]
MVNVNIAKEIRIAIKQGNVEKVMELIDSNKEIINLMTPFGTWLHVAASHGKLEIIKYLVNSGLDVNIKGGTFNAGAINRAASEGHLEIVKYLITCGAELDISEPDRNPLFAAIYGGHGEIVELLIDSGINTTVKYTGENMSDMDAYAFAIERGQKEIAELLKNK